MTEVVAEFSQIGCDCKLSLCCNFISVSLAIMGCIRIIYVGGSDGESGVSGRGRGDTPLVVGMGCYCPGSGKLCFLKHWSPDGGFAKLIPIIYSNKSTL